MTVKEGRYTDPQQALEFLEHVDVEALAVGVGTHHGQFKSKTKLNWSLIEELHQVISKPMVIQRWYGITRWLDAEGQRNVWPDRSEHIIT